MGQAAAMDTPAVTQSGAQVCMQGTRLLASSSPAMSAQRTSGDSMQMSRVMAWPRSRSSPCMDSCGRGPTGQWWLRACQVGWIC
jgi:hypothetical protein